jgi:thiol-disulfide isomerase/thioredoxin
VNNSPYLYEGPETPGTLAAMARVFTVDLNNDAVAYPYDLLRQLQAAEDVVGGEPIVVLWQPGTSSALDRFAIAEGRDVGSIAAFSRTLDGQALSFEVRDDVIVDTQTGSTWDVLGRALDGPLQGEQLDAVVGVNHFWFSWAAFKPETRVYTGESSGNVEMIDDPAEEAQDMADEEVKPTPSISRLLMDFEITLYQGQKALGGETVNISDILAEGKPMVVVFWAGLCPICRVEMPDIQQAYLEFGDRVNFIGVDIGLFTNLGSRADAENLIQELGLEFPSGATMDFEIMPTYEIISIPTTLFMKPSGLVLRRENTLLGKELLYERIEALIESSAS